MLKTSFTTAAILSVAQAVNTREFMHQHISDLVEGNLGHQLDQADRKSSKPRNHLAQLMAEQSRTAHTCTTAMERNRNTVDDFLTINAGTDKYTDASFPTNDALYWADAPFEGRMVSQYKNDIEWQRISDDGFPQVTMWGPNGKESVNPQDINQGDIGNCWIMAAISAIAEVPGRTDSVFVNDEISEAGIYAVQMYTLGVPFTQIVDDYLPMNKHNDAPIFGGLGKDGSIWGAILEKAFAKRYGNYEHTIGGWMFTAVEALNGSPYKWHSHRKNSSDDIWKLIKEHDIDTDVMTAASYFCGSHDQTNGNGVACSHAYTVLSCMELETDNGKVKLIKIRNPWGKERYAGPWSDSSSLWTDELRELVNQELGDAKEQNDGIFFMDLESYYENFQLTSVNQDTSNWHHDYFLMFDDEEGDKVTEEYCLGCTQHTITVTNDASSPQDIYVGAHVWQDKTYGNNKECQEAKYGNYYWHRLIDESTKDYYQFDTHLGSAWTDAIQFAAGETKEFTAVFDWERANVAKDWSVTAWGTTGEVTVANKNTAIQSQHMPQYTDHLPDGPEPFPLPSDPVEEIFDHIEEMKVHVETIEELLACL